MPSIQLSVPAPYSPAGLVTPPTLSAFTVSVPLRPSDESVLILLWTVIVKLAARYKLPAVYAYRHIVVDGGLASYGPDWTDQFRRAAEYVDRILRGEKPADLPVQAPTKYELAVNLNTAKTLGLTVADSLLARADELIE